MRNYKAKRAAYLLPKERYAYLRDYCMHAGSAGNDVIEAALKETAEPALAAWIRLHVTTKNWKWARLEANRIPCSRDTFRLYRLKFFFNLDKKVPPGVVEAEEGSEKHGQETAPRG